MLKMISNPFPDQTPKEILCRSYLLSQFNWVPGATTFNLKFPQALFALDTIMNYLSVFEYFRAGVKISVRVNSTPYHQGSLVTGVIPCRDITNLSSYLLANLRPVVLSASVQDSCTVEVPYLNPLSWLDIATCADYAICTFTMRTLNSLLTTSTGIPASVPVSVFAAFVNPETAGFIEPSSFKKKREAYLDKKKKFSKFDDKMKAQSTKYSDRRIKYEIPSVANAPDTQKEGEDKAKNGTTVKGVQKIVGGASEIIKMLPVIGAIWTPIAKFISTFGSVLDVPYNPAVTTAVDLGNAVNDVSHVQGVFSGQQLSLYPGVQTSKESFNMESSYMLISEMAQIPALYLQNTFALEADTFFMAVTPLSPGSFLSPDYLAFVAAEFRFWRGSIKYLLHFVNSAFYSARFRISYCTTVPGSGDGDLPQMIVDVKGDTWVEFTVPYLHPLVWRPTGDAFAISDPRIYVTMLTSIAGSSAPSAPVIYCNVWRAGGEDIQFNMVRNSYYVYAGSEEKNKKSIAWREKKRVKLLEEPMKAQSTITTRFSKSFAPILAGGKYSAEFRTCNAELPIRVSDMMKRWAFFQPNNLNTPGWDVIMPQSLTSTDAIDDYEPFQYFSQVFNFWRGSRRIRLVNCPFDQFYNYFNSSTSSFTSDGMAMTIPTGAGFIPVINYIAHNDIEIPWLSEVPYNYVYHNPTIPYAPQFDNPVGLTVQFAGDGPNDTFWKAGDRKSVV